MTSKARLLALATTLGIALSAPSVSSQPAGEAKPAAAQPTKEAREEAASRFRKGFELFKEGDYQAALIEFRRAYELAPNYNVLYNIGQVHFQLQDYANALTSLERYLAEGGDKVPDKRKEEVQRDIDKLKARIANLDITTNVPEVEIAIDDVPMGKTPFAKPVMVSAGRHRITATKEGFRTVTRIVEVAGADSLKLPLELAEQKAGTPQPPPETTGVVQPPPLPTTTSTSPPPPPPPVEEPRGIPWAGWAVTGAFAAGAAITGVLAITASSELSSLRGSVGQSRDSLDSQATKVTAFAIASDVLTGCAVVAGGISLYLTITSGPSKPEDEATPAKTEGARPTVRPTVRLGVLPGGVQLTGSF
jgi:hypothetical protein